MLGNSSTTDVFTWPAAAGVILFTVSTDDPNITCHQGPTGAAPAAASVVYALVTDGAGAVSLKIRTGSAGACTVKWAAFDVPIA